MINIVERFSNYAFVDVKTRTATRTKGCKLGNSFIAYIWYMLLRNVGMFDLSFPKRQKHSRDFQRISRKILNSINTRYVHTGCQKGVTQEVTRNDKHDDQLTKKATFTLYYNYHYFYW